MIHTPALDVLLLERADAPGFWQSVTGSKDSADEPLVETCVREVAEETGIAIGSAAVPLADLRDWSSPTSTTSTRAGGTAMRRA